MSSRRRFERTDPPRPTGKPAAEVSLDGALIPWFQGQPDYVQLANGPLAIAVFSTLERLEAARAWMGLVSDGIKKIDDGPEFLSSIPASIAVILDPVQTPQGTVRYQEVKRG